MSNKSIATIATMGIDIGKNSFHVVGLDRANETARALISMMARSTTRSNQRPDTLMQDRKADRSMKTSCDARPDHRVDATASMSARPQKAAVLLRCRALALRAKDRDRGEPRGAAPPTPPYVRGRIRRFEKSR
jgi:hypothetical protein